MNVQSDSMEMSSQNTQNDLERHSWISVAAYYKAQHRGGLPGKELDDWLEAELDYLEMKIKSFILRCREDGAMTVIDLRKLAYSIGVQSPELINYEFELIREIQKVCRHRPCFQSNRRMICEEVDCEWASKCRKLIAVWKNR